MEAVATTGAHGLSIDNNSLQGMLKDEVKIAFDNATGNEIFARKYKVKKSAEGKLWCIVKRCTSSLQGIHSLHTHCLNVHEISFSFRGEFIFHIKLEQRQINVFDMSSEDARSIKYLPESVSVSNDCAKATGIIEESSFSKDNNDLQYRLKDEVINAFENYIDDNHYGGKYKVSTAGNMYECIINGCDRSYKSQRSWRTHCLKHHNIKSILRDKYIIAIEKTQDNTNATKTTTDNMDSNRKRSHSLATHEEESNAKKARLNTLESEYLQSSATLSSISNSCEESPEFSDRFLDIITDDDSFVTPIADNTASRNTGFQFSATSQNIDDNELLELLQELIQTNNDLNTGELLAKVFTSGMI